MININYLLSLILFTSSESNSTNTSNPIEDVTSTTNLSWSDVLVRYAILAAIIFVSLILIALVKRSFKKEASLKKLKIKLDKAKSYASKIKTKVSKQDLIIATTRLNKLSALLSDATWISSRTAEEKRDVILEDITSSIDALSTYVGDYASEAFYTKDDYINNIEYVIKNLDSIKNRILQFEKDDNVS